METIWKLKKADNGLVDDLAFELEMPATIAKVLAVRGITNREDANDFLKTEIKHLHNPS